METKIHRSHILGIISKLMSLTEVCGFKRLALLNRTYTRLRRAILPRVHVSKYPRDQKHVDYEVTTPCVPNVRFPFP